MPSFRNLPSPAWRDKLIAVAIFGVCFVLFHISPVNYVGDSRYTLLLAQNLLSKGSFVLDAYAGPSGTAPDARHPLSARPYQVETSRDGHIYYYLPPGDSVLSAPFVVVADLLGQSVLRPDGTYDLHQEERDQLFIAAVLMAFLAVIFYYTARLVLPPGWSAWIALGGVLATQIWSTATRSLCSQTWGCSLLATALYLLLAQETGRRRLNPVLLATILSWSYFVRPTSSLLILAVTVYLLIFYRRWFFPYALTGAAWAAGFVMYSWAHFGTILPSYYAAARLQTATYLEALAGNLISPGRGLLLYVPVTLFVVYLLLRYWRDRVHERLSWLAIAVCVAQWLAISGFPHWWGGDCYGSRFTTELVPCLVLLTILGAAAAVHRWTNMARPLHGRLTMAGGVVLLLLSTWINARGALAQATWDWNHRPAAVDENPARLWEWRYPQALAGLVPLPGPAVFPVLHTGERLSFAHQAGQAYRLNGWSQSEPEHTWTAEQNAVVIFAAEDRAAKNLRLCFWPFIHNPQVPRQHVDIQLNGHRLATLDLDKPDLREETLDIPANLLRAKNYLSFDLPDAVPANTLGSTEDGRTLGIAVRWLELDAKPGG